jgi:hypothetical protein
MQFEVPGAQGTFEIPDDWWDEAGMRAFKAQSPSYTLPANIIAPLVPLTEVLRPPRTVVHDLGGFCRNRMVGVLVEIATVQAIYPVDMENINSGAFRYGLRHGFHRYCASIAAGFTHIPARMLSPL